MNIDGVRDYVLFVAVLIWIFAFIRWPKLDTARSHSPVDFKPRCPRCSTSYDPSDYRSDVVAIYCSACGAELPRGLSATPRPMNSDALEQLRSNLGELLGHHGHPTSRYEDWLLIDGKFPAIRVSFYHQEASHPTMSQVDFQIAVAKDVVIRESFAVVGDSDSALAVDALARFSRNSLHVILASICEDTAAAEHVEIIELTGSKDSSWRAYLSGWQLTTYEGTESTPPSAVFESVEALLKERLCDTKIHWFRILLSTLGRTQLVEILWDNETWQEAEETVRRLDWVSDNQQTARCFAIVLPQSSFPGG